MKTVVEILGNMLEFSAVYCLMKCVRSILLGTVVFALIFLVRGWNRGKRADINFYAMLLMIPAAFTGMSKLFSYKKMAYISVILYRVIKPIHGQIYLGVMAILLVRFLWKNHSLAKRVRMLSVWEDEAELEEMTALVTRDTVFGWQKRYLGRTKVYVTEEMISPFSGGLLRPYVVMPEAMLKCWPEDERRAVLCHELVHLKAGHIFWTVLFQLVKIYWWGNPLIYLCDRLLKEDMEKVCDEQCIRYANVSLGTYGKALLDMIALMQGISLEGTLCFSEKNDFQTMKRRIGSLPAFSKGQCALRWRRKQGVIFAGVFATAFVAVAVTSYPKYTRLPDIVLYDENIKVLDNNSDELRAAVQVVDRRLVIDKERFGELMAKMDVSGDYVYISFNTIMKVPGSGGCGNSGMVAVDDYDDIFYLAAGGLEGMLQEFWLMFLI